jgi:Tat protein secretion system quality control protein TatD with DNase activity
MDQSLTEPIQSSLMLENWLVNRSLFLSDRLILEIDYPYLSPRNRHGTYDPSCAILGIAIHLAKTINNPNESLLSYVESSNTNIEFLYGL